MNCEKWDSYISILGLMTPEESSLLVDCILHNRKDVQPSQVFEGWTALPSYIEPLPEKLSDDDIADLSKKGVLSVPCDGIRNEIVTAFLKYVYPFMPVLNLRHFLHAIFTRQYTTGPRVSLFLFHAVMFSGSMYLDTPFLLHQLGYRTRKNACNDFYRKARLLYEIEYDSDPLSRIPALLLLSYWYKDGDNKDPRYWIENAISASAKAQFDSDDFNYTEDDSVRRLRRRIWWSCYIRDCLASLAAGRPLSIKEKQLKISNLTIEDFDLAAADPYISILSADLAKSQLQLALICLEMAKLCVCIREVLRTLFSPTMINDSGAENSSRTVLQPILGQAISNHSIERDFLHWYLSLAPEADLGRQSYERWTDIDLVHRSFLHLVYYACRDACCRAQLISPDNTDDNLQRKISKNKRKHFASLSVSIVKQLQRHNAVQFLPPTAAPILLPTLVEQIRASKFDTTDQADALDNVDRCIQALEVLRDRYSIVDVVLDFVYIFRERITRPSSDRGLDIEVNYQNLLHSLDGGLATYFDDPDQFQSLQQSHSHFPLSQGNEGIIMDLDDFLDLHDD